MLPTYVDHILYPNLTEAAFITEVHHITEKGESQGVVYCEMQSRENTPMIKGPSPCSCAEGARDTFTSVERGCTLEEGLSLLQEGT